MKKQMIKLSVIAAVLSGMAFTASAAPVSSNELDLHALVQKGACMGTPGAANDLKMDFGTIMLEDFPTNATPTAIIQGMQAKTAVISYKDCSAAMAKDDTVNLVATQMGADATVADEGLWGDDTKDRTGLAFMIEAEAEGTSHKLTQTNNEFVIYTADQTYNAKAAVPIPDVTFTVSPVSYVDKGAAKAGSVSAVVMLAAVQK